MDTHTLDILEFGKVRAQIRQYVACSLGADQVDLLQPEVDARRIRPLLDEVAEARRLFELRGQFPFGGIHDVRPALEKASVAGILSPSELLDVLGTLVGARQLQAFLRKPVEGIKLLSDLARTLGVFPKIEAEIDRCITPKAEVADNATPQLATIRQKLRITHNRMMDRLQSILRSARPLIQDPVVTIRDGRYCIPVKAESRREFGGLVHDSSASGATVFMEPQVVVELGNEIRELQIKEEQEVEKVLRGLAELIAGQIVPIQATVRTLARLDLISAKARWANDHRAVEPELDAAGRTDLRGARHPLLEGDVVPIDVQLGGSFTALIVTGPNTGGKTVTLKTIGLLTLLTQAGVPIPAEAGSRVAVYPRIFADIGDEQSIQQSLSTFSSHIRQIVKILGQVDSRTLVLLDELGAGTDPAEGAALAKSILKFMLARGARICATTHYGELKEFAFTEPGCKNASVEFDERSLKPTYRLLIGVPGSSNAITIASRLGMLPEVIEGARQMFDPDRAALEELYREMEEDRRLAERNRTEAQQAKTDAERIRQEYLEQFDRLQRRKERETEQAALRAREIVRKARQEADQILARLREQEREGKVTEEARQTLHRIGERIERHRRRREPVLPELPESAPLPELTDEVPLPGDSVFLAQFGQTGLLLRRDDGDSEVQVGAMRLTVPTRTLRRAASAERAVAGTGGSARASTLSLDRTLQMGSEIDLRGQRVDEALLNLEKYLDDARLSGMAKVRVIHGKGLGALRKIVWDAARADPTVKQISEAPPEEGGAGVAVIDL